MNNNDKCLTAICSSCGNEIDINASSVIKFDGKIYCDDFCAASYGVVRCDCCTGWIYGIDGHSVEDGDVVCEDCFDSHYSRCDDCGEMFHMDNMVRDDSTRICQSCFEDNWCRCYECRRLIDCSDTYTHNNEHYCGECVPDEACTLHDYGYKPGFKMFGCGDLFMGVELEIDSGENRINLAEKLDCFDEIYCKRDGSLGSDGIEIVTHPATLEYHEKELDWGLITSECLNEGYLSHDTDTCGLHVHVNRNFFGDSKMMQDLNIAKVILIIIKFWDSNIVAFSRRSRFSIDRWASKNSLTKEIDDDEQSISRKVSQGEDRGRYVAVNIQNENTVEFRIFRGTLKPTTLLATFQFVDTLCRFAAKIDLKDIDHLQWHDIFEGITHEELHKYLKKISS